MPHSQVREIFPGWDDLPILQHIGSEQRCFLIDIRGHPLKNTWVSLDLVMYLFEPSSGMMFTMKPDLDRQDEVVVKWEKDPFGTLKQRRTFKHFRQVDFQDLEPGELLAVEREIVNVVTARRKGQAKRLLQHLRDENYHTFSEKAFVITDATTPWNPRIDPDRRRPVIIKR